MNTLRDDYRLRKTERLFLKKEIDELFCKGSSFIAYPLRVVYIIGEYTSDKYHHKVLVSVSKKYHKRANKRNRIKRIIREVYRHNKHRLIAKLNLVEQGKSIHLGIMYISKELPDILLIQKSMEKIYHKLQQ